MNPDEHQLPNPQDEPTIELWSRGARPFGYGRSGAYEAAKNGTFPVQVLRVGGRHRVATARVRLVLGLDREGQTR